MLASDQKDQHGTQATQTMRRSQNARYARFKISEPRSEYFKHDVHLTYLDRLNERNEQSEHNKHKLLTRIFYVYITKIVFLNRSFVLNSCNSQYNQFYCLSYLQISVYSSKKFVTLVYFCLYLMLLVEQLLHFKHRLFTRYQRFLFDHVFIVRTSYIRTERFY